MRRIRNFCFKSIISPFQVSYCCLRHDTSPTSYNPARSAPRALRRLSVPPQGLVQTIRLPRVFLNRDSRPTAQIFADTSHGRESPRYLAVTSGHGHRGRRAHLFFAANQQVPRPFYERSWTAPLHRKVGLKSTNELIRINSGATKARMLTFMLMSGPGQSRPKWAFRPCPVYPPIATELRTSLEVRSVPDSEVATPHSITALIVGLLTLVKSWVVSLANHPRWPS